MARSGAAAFGLLLAASTAAAEVRTGPLVPWPPDYRPDIARRLDRVSALVERLTPPEPAPGLVEVIEARDVERLRKSFLDDAERTPGWTGRAIRIAGGAWPLGALAEALAAPELLACAGRSCELRVPVLIEAGASLHIGAGAGPAELELSPEHGAFIVGNGLLFLRGASLSGAGLRGAAPGGFRPFLLIYDEGRLVVAASRLAHLGFDAPSAYGVTLSTTERDGEPAARPSALIHESQFRDLYYGFYSHGAEGVDIVDSRYIDSVEYGIDPHDGTTDMLVARNIVQGTRGAHGIVASRQVSDLVVHDNRSIDNAGSGIVLDRGVVRATVTDNLVTGNGGDGIAVYESHQTVLAGNRIVGNGRSGIRLRQSADAWISGNTVVGNGRHGLEASSRTPERQALPEEASHARPVTLTLAGNRFADNRESACTFKGIARLDLVPAAPGAALAPCGEPEAVAGDEDWAAALAASWTRREPLRLEVP